MRSKTVKALLYSAAGAVLLSTAATSGVKEHKSNEDDRIRREYEASMVDNMEQQVDMSDSKGSDLYFAGYIQKDGKKYARFKSRKTEEMMRQMGPEKAKEFKTVTLDPNNPEDMKKKIYI